MVSSVNIDSHMVKGQELEVKEVSEGVRTIKGALHEIVHGEHYGLEIDKNQVVIADQREYNPLLKSWQRVFD